MSINSTSSIEDRLRRIEDSLSKITDAMDQAPSLNSIATDTVDEMFSDAKRQGVDVDERFKNAIALLGRLSDPNVSGALNGLLDFVEQAPGLISIAADSIDEGIQDINSGTIKMDDRIATGKQLLMRLSDPAMAQKIDGLLNLADQAPSLVSIAVDSIDEVMGTGENITFLKETADAILRAKNESPATVGGLWGTLRAFRDPDRQKALGFIMNALKNIGKNIK